MSKKRERLSAVDAFIKHASRWSVEMGALREILLNANLEEMIKWRHPCYAYEGKNLAIIQDFKEYCALMFVKGVLMEDPYQLLIQVGDSASNRQLRFTDIEEVIDKEEIIKLYIDIAIGVEQSGGKLKSTSVDSIDLPKELIDKFEEDSSYKEAFYSLTPGRQKAYIFHISKAKKVETRNTRIEKALPNILEGLGPKGK